MLNKCQSFFFIIFLWLLSLLLQLHPDSSLSLSRNVLSPVDCSLDNLTSPYFWSPVVEVYTTTAFFLQPFLFFNFSPFQLYTIVRLIDHNLHFTVDGHLGYIRVFVCVCAHTLWTVLLQGSSCLYMLLYLQDRCLEIEVWTTFPVYFLMEKLYPQNYLISI